MAALGWIWVVIVVVGLIDVFRHSSADWTYADRNRAFWAIFIFFFGPLFAIPYLFMVYPRFPGREDKQATDAFRRKR